MSWLRPVLVSALSSLALVTTPCLSKPEEECALSASDQRFVAASLARWEWASRNLLFLSPQPLPWTVLFNQDCVWHLSGDRLSIPETWEVGLTLATGMQPVYVRAQRRSSSTPLPDGRQVPEGATAMTGTYRQDFAAYALVALPERWRADRDFGRSANFRANLRGMLAHELTHTRQIVMALQRIRELGKHYALPNEVHDDVVEQRFGNEPNYSRAYRQEVDLFYQALRQPESTRCRQIVARALAMAEARRDRYYQGRDKVYAELEGLFLNMEGVAVWTAYKIAKATRLPSESTDPRHFGWRHKPWSQEEGLVLVLLLERLSRNWPTAMLGPDLVSPFTLLRQLVTKEG